MKTWIDKNRGELWRWIEACFNFNEDIDFKEMVLECGKCKQKKACDAIWDLIKLI